MKIRNILYKLIDTVLLNTFVIKIINIIINNPQYIYIKYIYEFYICGYKTTMDFINNNGVILKHIKLNGGEIPPFKHTPYNYTYLVITKKCSYGKTIKIIHKTDYYKLQNNIIFTNVNSPLIQVEITDDDTNISSILPLDKPSYNICIDGNKIPHCFYIYYYDNVVKNVFDKSLNNFSIQIIDNNVKIIKLEKSNTLHFIKNTYLLINE
jgi:hypothetical protein